MSLIRGMTLAVAVGGIAMGVFGARAASPREEIDAFNKRYVELHLKMDTAGIYGTWAEDGVESDAGRSAADREEIDCGVGRKYSFADEGV